jgi:SagB-type dehydrogenase family enzyme
MLLILFHLQLLEMSRSPSPTRKIINPILGYHHQTKHCFQYYARSSKFLDWANQPNPFRRYLGSPFFSLQLIDQNKWNYFEPSYQEIFHHNRNQNALPVTYQTISRFLELSLGLTAWKQAGKSTWSLRSNPSSGNLHPTEGFLLLRSSTGFESGLYHYCPEDHGLEMRTRYDSNSFESMISDFPNSSFFVGLTSIHWREAWKYGERAYRYCNHDIGHAIGSLRIAAATLGWNVALLDGMKQTDLALLLGTDRSDEYPSNEIDHPETLLLVWPQSLETVEEQAILIPTTLSSQKVAELMSTARWYGQANRLSETHGDHWDIIDHVASHTWKSTGTQEFLVHSPSNEPSQPSRQASDPLAADIIRQRRSAQNFNPETSHLSLESFLKLLSRVFPRTAENRIDLSIEFPGILFPLCSVPSF